VEGGKEIMDYSNIIANPEILYIMLDDLGFDNSGSYEATKRWCEKTLSDWNDEVTLGQLNFEAAIYSEGYEDCLKAHGLEK